MASLIASEPTRAVRNALERVRFHATALVVSAHTDEARSLLGVLLDTVEQEQEIVERACEVLDQRTRS